MFQTKKTLSGAPSPSPGAEESRLSVGTDWERVYAYILIVLVLIGFWYMIGQLVWWLA